MTVDDRYQLFNSFGDASTRFSFFPSESHKKAVHRITVGLESKCGLVMLTGEIGTGKTTLFRYIQNQKSDRFIYAEVGNPFLSPMEQVSHFCKSFGLKSPQSLRQGMAMLSAFFEEQHREGRQVVLIYDETHLLTKSHWGQILVFSNLRKNDEPTVQVLLVGQTELVARLMEPGLEALNQRIGIRCELSPLTLDDTRKYIQFKLESSDGNDIVFTDKALTEVWKISGGVPRLINHACSHLLDQIVFSGGNKVTPAMVKKLAADSMYANLFESRPKAKRSVPRLVSGKSLMAGGAVITVALSLYFFAGAVKESFFEDSVEQRSSSVSGKVVPASTAGIAHRDEELAAKESAVGSDGEKAHQPLVADLTEPAHVDDPVYSAVGNSAEEKLRAEKETTTVGSAPMEAKPQSDMGEDGPFHSSSNVMPGVNETVAGVEPVSMGMNSSADFSGMQAVNGSVVIGSGNETFQAAVPSSIITNSSDNSSLSAQTVSGRFVVVPGNETVSGAVTATVFSGNGSLSAVDASGVKGNGIFDPVNGTLASLVNSTDPAVPGKGDNSSIVNNIKLLATNSSKKDAEPLITASSSTANQAASKQSGNNSKAVANNTVLVLNNSSENGAVEQVKDSREIENIPGQAEPEPADTNSSELLISLGDTSVTTGFTKDSGQKQTSAPEQEAAPAKVEPVNKEKARSDHSLGQGKLKSADQAPKTTARTNENRKADDLEGNVLDGAFMSRISSIEIGAVAYSDTPADRLAVLDQKLMREGDVINGMRLLRIGKDELIFVFEDNKYRRVFGDRNDNE